jgi:hypothetical protein
VQLRQSLYWRNNPRKTHIMAEDTASAHMKDWREFLIVVACMSGINRDCDEIKIPPPPPPKQYKANNRTCIMTTIFLE